MLRSMNKPILNYKRTKRPLRSPLQRLLARSKCRSIYMNFRNHKFILDDESYFTLSNANLNSNESYYSSDRNVTPESVMYKDVAKFEKKLLVWVAISPSGMSKYWIVPSKMAINTEVYLKECIQKRLIPFIKKYHSTDKYILAHYPA